MNPSEMSNEQLAEVVAVEVMGWEWCPKLLRWVFGPTLNDTRGKREWSPATSIADAWEVIEKMAGQGRKFTLETFFKKGVLTGDACFSMTIHPESGAGDSIASPVPRAISLAAILAIRSTK